MRKILLVSSVLAASLAASGAFAAGTPSTGNITVTGTVTSACYVITGNTGSSTTTGTINLGNLANPNGTVNASAAGSSTGGNAYSFQVACNSSVPSVSMVATAMSNGSSGATTGGYTNVINYTATLVPTLTTGSGAPVAVTTVGSDSNTNNLPQPAVQSYTSPFATGGNNVTVSVGSLSTTSQTAVLNPGTYSGNVSVTITPTA